MHASAKQSQRWGSQAGSSDSGIPGSGARIKKCRTSPRHRRTSSHNGVFRFAGSTPADATPGWSRQAARSTGKSSPLPPRLPDSVASLYPTLMPLRAATLAQNRRTFLVQDRIFRCAAVSECYVSSTRCRRRSPIADRSRDR